MTMRVARTGASVALFAVVGLAACGEDEQPQACTPGQTIACACPGALDGVQTCVADGTGYGACESCAATGGSGGMSVGGAHAGGSGGESPTGGSGGVAGTGGTGGTGGALPECGNDTDCLDPSTYCAGGTCVAKNAVGTVCSNENECLTGNCIDGVCCDTACDGTCMACDVAGLVGTCSDVPAGQDPAAECPLGTCDGASACAVSAAWSKRFGDQGHQLPDDVAVDASGNIVLVGDFSSTINFGGGVLVALGTYNGFVAKFDTNGSHLWSIRFGDGNINPRAVALDSSGNILVVGSFSGTINFGGNPLTSSGGDVFVAKLDPSGGHIWSANFGDAATQGAVGVAVDANDNIILAGGAAGTTDFGGGPRTSVGEFDVFVTKFDASGGHVWSKMFGGAFSDWPEDVAVDGAGDVIMTGEFYDAITFGGPTHTSAGSTDIFIAKLSGSTGDYVWSKAQGTNSNDRGFSVAVDANDSILASGDYKIGTVDFGGGALPTSTSTAAYLVKFAPNGGHTWSKGFISPSGIVTATGVTMDAVGNAYATGAFTSTANYGGGLFTVAPSATVDTPLVKFDANGTHVASGTFSVAGFVEGYDIATDSQGGVVLVGELSGTADFGNGPLVSAGQGDVFVAKFSP